MHKKLISLFPPDPQLPVHRNTFAVFPPESDPVAFYLQDAGCKSGYLHHRPVITRCIT